MNQAEGKTEETKIVPGLEATSERVVLPERTLAYYTSIELRAFRHSFSHPRENTEAHI